MSIFFIILPAALLAGIFERPRKIKVYRKRNTLIQVERYT